MARRVWMWIILGMRKPGMRRLRRLYMAKIPPEVARRMARQDRFARRYGQVVLKVALTFMLISFAITACYLVALYLFASGILSQPAK